MEGTTLSCSYTAAVDSKSIYETSDKVEKAHFGNGCPGTEEYGKEA